jgi:hypothetical protein
MKGGIDEIKEAKWLATIKLEIVTPEAKTFSDDVDMVTLTGGKARWASCRSTCR